MESSEGRGMREDWTGMISRRGLEGDGWFESMLDTIEYLSNKDNRNSDFNNH